MDSRKKASLSKVYFALMCYHSKKIYAHSAPTHRIAVKDLKLDVNYISCTSTTAESRAKIWYQAPQWLKQLSVLRLLLLTFCLLLPPLWEFVIVLCFAVSYFMSILV